MQSLEEQKSETAADWAPILYAAASSRGGGVSGFDLVRGASYLGIWKPPTNNPRDLPSQMRYPFSALTCRIRAIANNWVRDLVLEISMR